ncbi:MAG TPA: bifunctional glutamate N-acetyltransferase/amino-acid acetyltransferase ArgJ [Candidatus Hypogeohydataceae bacterium YC38]|nr:bifunctional glutamate N-acetyltransferase/amino-acid acetyltransferase ArgJ [Candidatus Brocadiales bacterium]
MEEILGGIVAPKGFLAGAVQCGLKKEGYDLGVVFSQGLAQGTGLFTTNEIVAAPVKLCRKTIEKGPLRALVVNSGNANACTGEQGDRDARSMAEAAARALGISPQEVLVASTGIIGEYMPMEKVVPGIMKASQELGREVTHSHAFAHAIMTTDTFPKEIAVEIKIRERVVTLGGVAKGAGMIAPRLATMLCFITTDAPISKKALDACLQKSADQSFNCISVDGHMSTNDTVILLANGEVGGPPLTHKELPAFQEALDHVTRFLAKAIVRDGEGATKFVRIEVSGARKAEAARHVASAIANSPLVKTAINGEDPNWGRIVSAAGAAGIPLDEKRLKLYIGHVLVFEGGTASSFPMEELLKEMKKEEIDIRLHLGLGTQRAEFWTCDLSQEYVTVNARYHT